MSILVVRYRRGILWQRCRTGVLSSARVISKICQSALLKCYPICVCLEIGVLLYENVGSFVLRLSFVKPIKVLGKGWRFRWGDMEIFFESSIAT